MSDNTYSDTMKVGEKHIQEFNATLASINTGETLGAVTWTSSDEAVVALSSQAESGNRTQVLASALSAGTSTLTCSATFGVQVVKGEIEVTVS